MRLTSTEKGIAHHLTVPAHRELAVGTLRQILKDAAMYLEKNFADFVEELFQC
jgi:hypothetical protein